MLNKIICIIGVVSIISVPAIAQAAPDTVPAIEAVKKVAFLEGSWTGEGWIQMGQGQKEEFDQIETVELKQDGAAILIEGIGHTKGEKPKKIHHALAFISFDPLEKKLVFSSFVAGRQRLDVIPEVNENEFVWGFSPPNGGEIRYTIKIEDGRWQEVGEYSRDGQSWFKFFEMHLKKQ
ncbi:hypothetical protein ACFLT9_04320 [Acidobacteriota bacterium]